MFQSTNKVMPLNNTLVVLAIHLLSKSMKSCFKTLIAKANILMLWQCVAFVCVIHTNQLSAQSIELDRKTKPVPTFFFKDTDNKIGIDDILKGDISFNPQTDDSVDDLDATYWIRLDFKDELDTLTTHKLWHLRTSVLSQATMYYWNENSVQQKSFGQFNNKEEEKGSLIYYNGASFEIGDLINNRYLYIKAKMYFPFSRTIKFRYLSYESNRFYTKYYTEQDINKITPSHYYFGACSIIFLTFLVIYMNIKKSEFLFYALYVLFSLIYLSGYSISALHYFFASKATFWIIVVSQILINLFYLIFAKFYLNTPKHYPLLNNIINIVIGILLVFIILDAFSYYNSFYKVQENILDFQRGLMTLFGVFSMLYLLSKPKDMLVIFIVVGSFIYMTGALGYLFIGNKNYMMVGSIVEILIFSLGLAYKIKLDYEDRLNLQKEISAKEISAKRAQMNPHFIFNSLNSIQHLILQNNKKSALKYLSKFSKLTRNVLESSHLTTVTLDEEISVIKSYLELESLRFDNSFNYSIVIDDNLDIANIEIPLMLLQPYVENALIHGLIVKKEGEKNLSIRFLKADDHCTIVIEDNGIGRHSKIAEYKKNDKKSRGMEITEKRLLMLNSEEQINNSVEIIDKYDSNGRPSGTKVIIRIHNP